MERSSICGPCSARRVIRQIRGGEPTPAASGIAFASVDSRPMLMTVPNVSEGRDLATLEAIGRAFSPAHFLDLHTDPDHDRAVFTLAARQGDMAEALIGGGRPSTARSDLSAHTGIHPHVGALDVMPVVYLDEERRGAAIAEALTGGAGGGEVLGGQVSL